MDDNFATFSLITPLGKFKPEYSRPPAIPAAHAGLVIEVGVSAEQHVRGELGHPFDNISSSYCRRLSKHFDSRVALLLIK